MSEKTLSVILIVATLLVVFLIQVNSRDSILIKEMVYVSAGILALVLTSAAILTGRPVRYGRVTAAQLLLLGCILAWMLVSHFTGVRSVNAPYLFSSLAALAGISLALALFLDTKWRDRLLLVLVIASALLSLYAILQWRSVNIFKWDIALNRSGRVSGSLGNPNLLGSFICAIIPLAVCFILDRKQSKLFRGPSIAIFTVLGCLALVASGTRGSLIGLAAGLLTVVLFLMLKRTLMTRKAGMALAAVLILLLVGSIVLMAPRLAEMTATDSGTVQVRKLIWSGTLDMIFARPLTGWGPGSFQIAFPGFRSPFYHMLGVSHNTLHAHSEYLEVLSDTGIVGALLWLALIVLLVRGVRKSLPLSWTTVGIVSALVAIAAEATVSVALRWPPTAYLAAILIGLLLASTDVSPGRPALRWRVPVGIAAGLTALLLALLALPGYLDRMSAGSHLFIGKDIYLSRIESEMNRAKSSANVWQQSGDLRYRDDAVTWWGTARSTVDSSIEECMLATGIDSDDLGAWYALGSGYLTKALLVQPQDPALIAALEESGMQAVDPEEAMELTRMALAAYDSLASRAPDYAELHNNLALAYTRLGLLDDTFSALRRSYAFFAHRRVDYERQVTSLLSLRPFNHDAWHVLWLEMSSLFHDTDDLGEAALMNMKLRMQGMLWFTGMCFLMDPAGADSLRAVFDDQIDNFTGELREDFRSKVSAQVENLEEDLLILRALEGGERTGLMERVLPVNEGVWDVSPARSYVYGTLLCEEGDPTGLKVLLFFGRRMIVRCKPFISQWPGGCRHLSSILDFTLAEGVPAELDSIFMETVFQLLWVDRILLAQCRLALEDFVSSADQASSETIVGIWNYLGGPGNSLYSYGGTMPWSPGSLLEETAVRLALLSAEHPDDERYALLELRFYYLLFVSLWWDTPVFTDEQRTFIINSLIDSRSTLTELLGEDEAIYRAGRAISLEHERTAMMESRDVETLMERFRTDITHDLLEPFPWQD